jgi:hypothetical protein
MTGSPGRRFYEKVRLKYAIEKESMLGVIGDDGSGVVL